MREPFREFPLGSFVIIVILALIGLGLLVRGIMLVVDPQTRSEAIVMLLFIVPDVLVIFYFYGGSSKWE